MNEWPIACDATIASSLAPTFVTAETKDAASPLLIPANASSLAAWYTPLATPLATGVSVFSLSLLIR